MIYYNLLDNLEEEQTSEERLYSKGKVFANHNALLRQKA
jgi:hypothetical protein